METLQKWCHMLEPMYAENIYHYLKQYVQPLPRDVVDHECTSSTAVITARHRPKSLLSRCVPNL